jgi:U3 small nucleolar RNA-associated protein 22
MAKRSHDTIEKSSAEDSDSEMSQSSVESEEESEEEAADPAPRSSIDKSTAKKRSKISGLPTKDEQLQLNNTDTLLRSNLLKLQVDEMLNEVSCEGVLKKKKLQNAVSACVDILKSMGGSKMEGKEITSSWLKKEGLEGFDSMQHTSKGGDGSINTLNSVSIAFAAPASVTIVGSSQLNTGTSPFVNVDIAVGMPDSVFAQTDILNYAYFKKRALYLGALCAELKRKEFATDGNASVALLKGDVRKPIIVVKVALKGVVASIRIIPTMTNTVFKLLQFRAEKNNVRPTSWDGTGEADQLQGTPHYNMALLEDIAAQTQIQFLEQSVATSDIAKSIIVLFKIWLAKRGMRFTTDHVDSHTCTMLVAYLVQTKRITGKVNTLSGFTLLLKFLAETDFGSSILDFTTTKIETAAAKEGEGAIHRWPLTLLYPVFDKSRADKESMFQYNVLWRVSASAFSDLATEARRSLQLLQSDRSATAFQIMFMDRSSFFDRHDLFFHVPIRLDVLQTVKEHVADVSAVLSSDEDAQYASELQTQMDAALSDQLPFQVLSAKVVELAQQALGNRVKAVNATLTQSQGQLVSSRAKYNSDFEPSWPLSASKSSRQSKAGQWTVTLGVVLDSEFGHRIVERGPSADDITRLLPFRRFWGGEKSQIRRFQDGSIIEAVVWDEEATSKGWVPRGERITEEILRHILSRHLPGFCGRNGQLIISKTSQLEHCYLPGNVASGTSSLVSDAGSLFKRAVEKFDQLRRMIISDLKGIPLVIDNILSTSPMMRYTGVLPLSPHPLLMSGGAKAFAGEQISLLASPISIVAVVEGGGKWPKKSEAILKVKLALLLRIGELLSKQFKMKCVPHQDTLDIVFDGYIFRLSLRSSLEVERTVVDDNPFSKVPVSQEMIEDFEVKPLHHNLIRALHSQHPSYGPSVRLFSSWLCGHSLSGLLSQELIELLVASVYTSPMSESAPSSPTAGFQKTLVRLAGFDWTNCPLIVDFDGHFDQAKRLKVTSAFSNFRQQANKSRSMYVVSNCDEILDYKPYSDTAGPSKIILDIIQREANTSLDHFSTWFSTFEADKDESMLAMIMSSTHLMQGCDITLDFSETLVNKKAAKSSGNEFMKYQSQGPPMARLKMFSNLSEKELSAENLIVVDGEQNPMHEHVVANLRRAFEDVALFFWNARSATKIGVMWKPSQFMTKKFSVVSSRHHTVTDAGFSVKNASEIVREMVNTSEGLITLARF